MTTLNTLNDLKKGQGPNKDIIYLGVVVDDDDSGEKNPYTCRIRVRIPMLYDGWDDQDIPWAVPSILAMQGATNISGTQFVPQKGSEVGIMFPEGSVYKPVWVGSRVNDESHLQEMEHNYPRRMVTRFKNMALLVVDIQDNIVYLRNPGTVKLYVEGNVELEVKGNVEERIHGSVTREIKGDLTERILGNKSLHVGGDSKEHDDGQHQLHASQLLSHSEGATNIYAAGTANFQAAGNLNVYGQPVNINTSGDGSPGTVSVDKQPAITEWQGIRGGSKGSNDRK